MAAISSTPRGDGPPAWVGTVGIALGTGIGAAACFVLAHVL
jgi:hypothetical protein